MRSVVLKTTGSLSQQTLLTGAIRDLHRRREQSFAIEVRGSYPELWESNPHVTTISDDDAEVLNIVNWPPPTELPVCFMPRDYTYTQLSIALGLTVRPYDVCGDIYLTDDEKKGKSPVDELTEKPGTRYWLIAASCDLAQTTRQWDPFRLQAVIDQFKGKLLFVQCGATIGRILHFPLNDVLNLVDKTSLRQLIRLIYHAEGIVCPPGALMHLAAAVEGKGMHGRKRPCIVIAGGTESATAVSYPNHQFLHTVGSLPCCVLRGCRRVRVKALGDGTLSDRSLCVLPTVSAQRMLLPQCMNLITVEDVVSALEKCLAYDRFA